MVLFFNAGTQLYYKTRIAGSYSFLPYNKVLKNSWNTTVDDNTRTQDFIEYGLDGVICRRCYQQKCHKPNEGKLQFKGIYIQGTKGSANIYIHPDYITSVKKALKSTTFINNQNQTVMAKVQIGTKKDGTPVMSNAKTASVYRATGTKNKKPAMVVPVQFVTLPQGFYTHATKYLETGKPYNGKRQFNTYVIGCAFTKNNKKLYVVAQLTYMGGKPAIAVNHYRGYSKRTAWIVFNNLPYHEVKYTQANGQSVSYKSDGTYHAAIQQNIRRRSAYYANRQNGGGNFRSSANGASFSRR